MAKDRQVVKAVWFARPLVMLPASGANHIGSGPQWKGWTLEVDRTTSELCISPPKDHPMGRIRVPMTNVAAYQISSASLKSVD